jgi:MinD-like ATPase involved in chromosome partitioning or flagellar assembly
LIAVGGPAGVGRTEIAVQVAIALRRDNEVSLVDADDVAPSVAQRLGLAIEPNLRTAIDAVEHARGDLESALLREARTGLPVIGGIPNPDAWAQVRPSEVVRVIDRLGDDFDFVVADGVGALQDVGGAPRGRFASAQAIAREADAAVAVCDASPVGVARLLAWAADFRRFGPETPLVVVVNRAPAAAFRRGELFDEIGAGVGAHEVVFVASDARVTDAAWAGTPVGRSRFTRALDRAAEHVEACPRRPMALRLDVAS